MTDREPPDWALPAWDATDAGPDRERPASARPPLGLGRDAPGPMAPEPIVPGGTFGLTILAVSDVTRAVRDAVRGDDRLRDVWVEGEVGRVTVSSAGHAYFTLKDERSQLPCVWFRDDRMASPFEPRTGLRVVAHGRVDVFDANGVYQLYVSAVQPAGFGDLALRFEALKARLAAEGLFDAARKRPLPERPTVIAVVTSATGRRLARHPDGPDPALAARPRGPLAMPGPGRRRRRRASSAPSAGSTATPSDGSGPGRSAEAPAVTILARGGGSLEDLWSFNDEAVVRAIVAHGRPVVCGVGHETDVTLADFAADVAPRRRRPPPSSSCPTGPSWPPSCGPRRGGSRRSSGGPSPAAARETAAERRALDGLSPTAQLAAARERAGLLLDRATRALRAAGRSRDGLGRPGGGPAGARGCGPARSGTGGASTRPGRRWPSSGPRRPSSAATRSSGGRATDGSSATRPRRRPGSAWRSGSPAARSRPRQSADRPTREPATIDLDLVGPIAIVAIGFVVGAVGRRAWYAPRAADRPPLEHDDAAQTAEETGDQRNALTRPTAARAAPCPIRRRSTFDEALAELQRTVAELETGGAPLEASIALYERGVALHERCAALLADAELRVSRLVERAGGAIEALELRGPDEA